MMAVGSDGLSRDSFIIATRGILYPVGVMLSY
jgi:hypothetical protein